MASSYQIIMRRRNRKARKQADRARRRFWTVLFGSIITVVFIIPSGVAFGSALSTYAEATTYLPDAGEDLVTALRRSAAADAPSTQFTDISETRVLYRAQDLLADERGWIALETLPPFLIDATLLSEDPDFFSGGADRPRFDPAGTLLRLWNNALLGPAAPDASITGRLVRNAVLSLPDFDRGDTLDLRSREIALVAEINRRYTPAQILEWHLNTNYYGSEVYGIEAAAQTYFGKRAVDLTLDEAALLAAIPMAAQYNPLDNEVAARVRGGDLLRLMLAEGVITQAQYDSAATAEPVIRRDGGARPQIAPEFVLFARRQAERILNDLGRDGARLVARGGLRIVTTLDVDLYLQAECALRAQIARLSRQTPPTATLDGTACAANAYLPPLSVDAVTLPEDARLPDFGVIVLMDARTGELRAMVGDGTAAQYQPGGTLQPFVYIEGFNGGLGGLYTPARMVLDIPMQFPGSEEGLIYAVSNPDGRFRGPMNLRDAMGAGLLPPAADVAYRQGMSNVIRTAHQMGLNSLDENAYDLMLLERGGSVSPIDVTYAYSVFATLGDMRGVGVSPLGFGYRGRDPVAVRRIEDASGAVLWQYDPEDASTCRTLTFCTPLLEKGLAYLVNDVLADSSTRVPVYGDSHPLDLTRPAAIVNTLTSDSVDNWAVGYTPQMVVSVLMRRDDRSPMDLPPLATDGAASVWRALMEYAHSRDSLPITGWQRPESIVEALVCETSGLAPNGVCPTTVEIFLAGTERLTQDTYWQLVEINNQTGQLATINTPAGLRTQARYFVPPSEARDWWIANNQPLPPTEVDTVSIPQAVSAARIASPPNYSYVGGNVRIEGTLNATNMRFYQLSYGQGLNPREWINLSEPVTNYRPGDALGVWDTAGLDGLYSLRLVLTRDDNTVESDVRLVTVDNIPPTVTLNSAEPGKVYRFPGDETVQVVAEAVDNLRVERVDFYANGQFLGSDPSWPFSFDWRIDRPGTQTFTAIVFDSVGNQAQAEWTVDVLRSGA